MTDQWTKPYYGVQHYGKLSVKSFWATVHDYEDFAIALIRTPGCGFSPMKTTHDTSEEAREYAEHRLYVLTQGCMGKNPKL